MSIWLCVALFLLFTLWFVFGIIFCNLLLLLIIDWCVCVFFFLILALWVVCATVFTECLP
jgi:hypothetical protein